MKSCCVNWSVAELWQRVTVSNVAGSAKRSLIRYFVSVPPSARRRRDNRPVLGRDNTGLCFVNNNNNNNNKNPAGCCKYFEVKAERQTYIYTAFQIDRYKQALFGQIHEKIVIDIYLYFFAITAKKYRQIRICIDSDKKLHTEIKYRHVDKSMVK